MRGKFAEELAIAMKLAEQEMLDTTSGQKKQPSTSTPLPEVKLLPRSDVTNPSLPSAVVTLPDYLQQLYPQGIPAMDSFKVPQPKLDYAQHNSKYAETPPLTIFSYDGGIPGPK